MVPIRYNVRSLSVRKATTVATAGGIALVVFVLASALMLSAGIKKTLNASGRADNAIVLRKGSDNEMASILEDPQVSLVLGAPGIKRTGGVAEAVAEIVVVAALEKMGADGVSNLLIRGVPENALQFRPEVRIVEGRPATPGADEVIIGQRIRGRFRGTELGQSFEIKKGRPVKVVGIFESGGSSYESEVWVDREVLRAAFRREGTVTSVRVHLESPSMFDAFQAFVEQDKRVGLMAQRESDYYEKQSEGTSIFVGGLGTVVAVIFAIGAMIGAMITMYGAVANRQREIGTLRALGFSRTSILFSFLLESLILALIGGVIGTVASMAMGFVKFSMINFASWSEMVFTFDPTPDVLITALVFAGGMGLAGGFFPAVRAARVSPIKAMRG